MVNNLNSYVYKSEDCDSHQSFFKYFRNRTLFLLEITTLKSSQASVFKVRLCVGISWIFFLKKKIYYIMISLQQFDKMRFFPTAPTPWENVKFDEGPSLQEVIEVPVLPQHSDALLCFFLPNQPDRVWVGWLGSDQWSLWLFSFQLC